MSRWGLVEGRKLKCGMHVQERSSVGGKDTKAVKGG